MTVENDFKNVRVSDILGIPVELGSIPTVEVGADVPTPSPKLYKLAFRGGSNRKSGLIQKNGFQIVIPERERSFISREGEVFPVQNLTEIRKINPDRMRDQIRIENERQESLSRLISLLAGEKTIVVRHRQVIRDGRSVSQSDMARLRVAHVSRLLKELIAQGRIERVSPGAFFFNREK